MLSWLVKADHHAGLGRQVNVFASDGQDVTTTGKRSDRKTSEWAAEGRATGRADSNVFTDTRLLQGLRTRAVD